MHRVCVLVLLGRDNQQLGKAVVSVRERPLLSHWIPTASLSHCCRVHLQESQCQPVSTHKAAVPVRALCGPWGWQTFNSCLAGPCSAACPWWQQGCGAAHEFKRCWPWEQRLERDLLQREKLFMVGIELQISKPGHWRWKADNCVKIHCTLLVQRMKTGVWFACPSQSTSGSFAGTPFPKHWHTQCCGTFFSYCEMADLKNNPLPFL